jgi:hypothetical protein
MSLSTCFGSNWPSSGWWLRNTNCAKFTIDTVFVWATANADLKAISKVTYGLHVESVNTFRSGSHVSHFLGWARSGIVFAVGKTQVYWPHTHLSPSSLRWRTFTWSSQIPPAPQRHRFANASARYLSSSWVIRTSGFPQWLRSGTVSQMRVLITFLAVEWYAHPVFRKRVNECGTVTSITAASSTEEMTDVWTGPYSQERRRQGKRYTLPACKVARPVKDQNSTII